MSLTWPFMPNVTKLLAKSFFYISLIYCLSFSQNKKFIQIPGTKIQIEELENFELQGMSPVMLEKKGSASVYFYEGPVSLEKSFEYYSNDYARDEYDWRFTGAPSPITINDMKGYFFNYQKTVGLIDQDQMYSQAFLHGDSLQYFFVTVAYHDSTRNKHSDLLRTIVNRLRWEKDKYLDPMELLNFKFQEKGAFKKVQQATNSVLYCPYALPVDSGMTIPFFSVKILFSRWNNLLQREKKNYFESILENIHSDIHVNKVIEFSSINLDGVDGYEAIAEGFNVYSDSLLGVYLTVLFHPAGYLGFVGVTPKNSRDENIELFKEMTRTFQRLKVDLKEYEECYKFMQSKQYSKADKCYDAALKVDPASVSALLGKAQALRFLGKYPQSIVLYDELLRNDKTLELAYIGRAEINVAMEKFSNAIYDYDKAIELNGNDLQYILSRAKAKQLLGNGPGAALDYEKAISLSPKTIEYYIRYAEASSSANEHAKALSILQKGAGFDSTNAVIHQMIGDTHYKMDKYEEALSSYNRAVRFGGNSHELFYQRGLTKLHLNDNAGAMTEVTKAIQRKTNYSDALFFRGRLKIYSGRLAESLEDFTNGRKAKPSEDQSLFYSGAANLFAGKYKQASDELRKSMASSFGLDARMWLFLAEGKEYGFPAAKKNLSLYLKQVTARTPYTYNLSGVKYALGDLTAENYIKEVSVGISNDKYGFSEKRKNREFGEAYFLMGLIEFVSGSKHSSKKYFQKCLDFIESDDFNYQIAKAIVNGSIR